MKKIVSLFIGMGMLSACSHEVSVTYDSVPTGATVYEQGVGELGRTPLTVKYNSEDAKVRDGKIYTDTIKVVWVSGSTLFVDPTPITLPLNNHAYYTFKRPQGAVYFEGDDSAGKDDQFALAYRKELPTTAVQYVVTPGQGHGFFDRFNKSVTCLYQGAVVNPYAVCD